MVQTSRYAKLNGYNGFEFEIAKASKPQFDYTISFWFRSHRDLFDLKRDYGSKRAYLFEIPDGPACWIQDAEKLVCDPEYVDASGAVVDNFEFNLSELPDFQAWIHLTYSANNVPGTFWQRDSKSFIQIDCQGFQKKIRGGYSPITSTKAYYGINAALDGAFDGDLREFFIQSKYYENRNDIIKLRHRAKDVSLDIMAYYKFDQDGFKVLDDAFRPQKGKYVYDKNADRP